MTRYIIAAALVLSSAVPSFAQAADGTAHSGLFISSLYGGAVTNKAAYTYYEGSSKKTGYLTDTGFMTGLYAQYVRPDLFQVNVFLYGAPDVNYSRVLGAHGNADAYFLNGSWGSCVAGIDVEDIDISMKAKSHLLDKGYSDMTMTNNVLFLMARAGAKLKFQPSDAVYCSIFPYAGITRETVDGNVTWDAASPYAPDGDKDFTEKDHYFSWGANVNVNILHFIDLTAKYLGRAKKGEYLNSVTGQANVYFSRSFGLSFQCKYMETDKQSYDLYNILGATLVF